MTSHFSTLLSACLFRHLVLMFAKPLINSRPIYPFCRQQKSKKARRKNSPFIHLPQTLFCHKQSLISLQTTLIHRGNKIKGLCKNIGGAHKGVLQEMCKRRMKREKIAFVLYYISLKSQFASSSLPCTIPILYAFPF